MNTPNDLEIRLRECERRIERLERKLADLEARIGQSAQQVAGLRQAPYTS